MACRPPQYWILLFGFLLVLLVVPPAHNYPISDDRAYARAVGRLLDLNYPTPEGTGYWPSHFAWGAIFSVLFGQSFDTLTASTLVMSAIALVAFSFCCAS